MAHAWKSKGSIALPVVAASEPAKDQDQSQDQDVDDAALSTGDVDMEQEDD
jgi:hypothetical protein